MDLTSASFIIVFLAGIQHSASSLKFEESNRRHHIYWDPKVTGIIKDPNSILQVKMGHFLDIVCPLANLGITDDPAPPVLFDLYNVTKKGFVNCDEKGGRLIFACSLPDQENKLTIKFQSISPSPFGFRFQECAEYYFLAVNRPSSLHRGGTRTTHQCTKKSERLRIRVACSDEDDQHETERKIVTTTFKPKTSFVDKIKNQMEKEKAKVDVVVPDVRDIPQKSPDEEKKPAAASRSGIRGENAASKTVSCNAFAPFLVSILSLIWFSILNSSS